MYFSLSYDHADSRRQNCSWRNHFFSISANTIRDLCLTPSLYCISENAENAKTIAVYQQRLLMEYFRSWICGKWRKTIDLPFFPDKLILFPPPFIFPLYSKSHSPPPPPCIFPNLGSLLHWPPLLEAWRWGGGGRGAMQHGNCSQLTALLLQNYHKLSYYIMYQHTVHRCLMHV